MRLCYKIPTSEGYRLWSASRRAEVVDGGVGAGRRAARRIRLGSNCLRCRRCWLTVARRVGDRELEGEKNGKGMDGGDPGNSNKRASNTKRDDHPLAFSRSLTHTQYFTLTAQITYEHWRGEGGRGRRQLSWVKMLQRDHRTRWYSMRWKGGRCRSRRDRDFR